MKLHLLAGAALATLLVAPAAFAQSDDWSAWTPGWYGAVDVGGHHTQAQALASPSSGIGLYPHYTDPDVVAFARIGYRLNGHIRLEIEGGYRHEGLGGVGANPAGGPYACAAASIGSGSCATPPGGEHAWTGMANVLFDILPHSRLNPFVGGGVGVVRTHLNEEGFCPAPACLPGGNQFSVDNGD
ncbi:MAG: hypothetical protein ABSD80_09850, partial [Caulobacteraceae bacterium]